MNSYPKKPVPRLEVLNGALRNEDPKSVTDKACRMEEPDVMNSLLSESNEYPGPHPAFASARATKIADLKHLIQTGNYQPDPKRVAESLLTYILHENC